MPLPCKIGNANWRKLRRTGIREFSPWSVIHSELLQIHYVYSMHQENKCIKASEEEGRSTRSLVVELDTN